MEEPELSSHFITPLDLQTDTSTWSCGPTVAWDFVAKVCYLTRVAPLKCTFISVQVLELQQADVAKRSDRVVR